jgi:DNA-binding MarR family transcriptional regulator
MAEPTSNRSKFKLENFLPEHMARLSDLMTRAMEAMGKADDLEVKDIFALIALAEFGALTATLLRAKCHLHKTRVSRLVKKMTLRGLIDVRKSSRDRRETIIRLTPAGRALHDAYVGKLSWLSQDLESSLPLEDREVFFKSLNTLALQASAVG